MVYALDFNLIKTTEWPNPPKLPRDQIFWFQFLNSVFYLFYLVVLFSLPELFLGGFAISTSYHQSCHYFIQEISSLLYRFVILSSSSCPSRVRLSSHGHFQVYLMRCLFQYRPRNWLLSYHCHHHTQAYSKKMPYWFAFSVTEHMWSHNMLIPVAAIRP